MNIENTNRERESKSYGLEDDRILPFHAIVYFSRVSQIAAAAATACRCAIAVVRIQQANMRLVVWLETKKEKTDGMRGGKHGKVINVHVDVRRTYRPMQVCAMREKLVFDFKSKPLFIIIIC